MQAEKLIQHYNRLNGNAITVERLKDYHAQVQKFLDSTGSGPFVNDLKGIYTRVAQAIKSMVNNNAYGVERVELVPIDITKTNGKILRVASGYKQSTDDSRQSTKSKSNSKAVVELDLKKIHTDTKRFQNRTDAFSEASANNVALHFDANKFDPIVVWKDKDGTTYVLSGHSRYEGMKRRKASTIPVRYFEGTEEEAIKFARVEANRSANQESLVEDLAAYKMMRDGKEGVKPATKTELNRIFKGKVGKLEAYSYLNPNGLFLQSLSQSNTSNYPYLERIAQWIGIVRNQYPVISHTGEDNIFHFFYSDKSGRNIKISKDDFFALVKKKVNGLRKDESVLFPECSAEGCKQTIDREADPQKGEAFKRLREINEALESIREKLTSKDATVRVTTDEEKKYLRATAEKLEAEKQRINRDLDLIDKSQASLFGVDDEFDTQLGAISKEEPLRTKQLKAMFARLADGGEKKSSEKNNEPAIIEKEIPVEQLPEPTKEEKKEIKETVSEYIDDIPKELARRSFYWTSFHPEKRGDSFREGYVQTLMDFRSELKPRAEKMGMAEQFESDFTRYRTKLASLANAYLNSHSRVASSMITGPANFPVERNRRASDRADDRYRDYLTFDSRVKKLLINKYTPAEQKAVKTGQDNALEILQKRLKARQKNHEMMLAANKIIRTKKSDAEKVELLVKEGWTEEQANKLLLPDWAGRKGYASFNLTNNNAEIKRLKDRIAQEEKLNVKRDQGNKKIEFAKGDVIENYDENRLQIIFPGKPDEATRAKLKRNGFKWAPSQGAWQRQLTGNARYVLQHFITEVLGDKKTEVNGPQIDAFNIEPKKKKRGPLNELQMAQLQDAIKAGRTPKVNLKAKLNAKQKPAPLFDEPVVDPKQASLFGYLSHSEKATKRAKAAQKKEALRRKVKEKTGWTPGSNISISDMKKAAGLNGIVDASALAGMQFRTFELTDRYKREFHKLNSDTQAMIWGSPGHGKTVWALQFAQYLAEKLNLKTLYIADEEFGRSTFSEKIRDFKIGNPNLHFAKRLDESVIDQYDAVFFDSINSIGMSIKDYQKFVDRHPGKLYVLIVQSTKDGDFRGGNDWEHEVDVAGEIRNRQLILHKNRFDKHNPEKMEKLMTENAIAEAKKKEVIKRAVKSQINTPAQPINVQA